MEKKSLYDKVREMNLKNIPFSDTLDLLNQGISLKEREVKNRIAFQPMEGCDGNLNGTPGELTLRRYKRFALSGAGIIWFEATALMKEGRANPRQLFMCEENISAFQKFVEEIKETCFRENGFEPIIIMQATHSGRYSKPTGVLEPIIAYNNPLFEGQNPIDKSRIITDDELKKLEAQYGIAADQALRAGFDGIDIKCCHRYLCSELLSAYNREGEFGGSFENRTRLLVNGIKNAKSIAKKDFIVTSRLNVYDGFKYPYGFGVKNDGSMEPDLTEPKKLIDILHNSVNVDLINISIGNPYVNPNVNRPSNTALNLEIENPLVGVDRMYGCIKEIQNEFPNLAVIGSGVSYFGTECMQLAAGAVEQNYMKIQGFGRMAFAYPDFYKDSLKNGELDPKKVCIACGKCTKLMRAGSVTGCVIRDREIYVPYYQKYCLKKSTGGEKCIYESSSGYRL